MTKIETSSRFTTFDVDGDGKQEWWERIGCLNSNGPALWQLARKRGELRSGPVIPERYLEATGECFILMIIVSWAMTYLFNPSIIEGNLLKDRVGYNNICVGFDTPPARYVAMPLQVLQAVLAVRYCTLDQTRAFLEKKEGRIDSCEYKFTRRANLLYSWFMICFPMLLVLTPDVNVVIHTFLFFFMLMLSFTVVAANFKESQEVTLSSKIWITMFGVHTFLLPVLGAIDFSTYTEGREDPPVPWYIVCYLDWGWFILLGLAVVFLPDSPPIHITYELILDESGKSASAQAPGVAAAAAEVPASEEPYTPVYP
eukprot:CAMPEP_0119313216 /NCGR_PEP_ID=MMETSP1333-20130426/28290_1 /TAXON_ID=418940 /ORGANISM="Scyphosphaera apsteinii, Strain RCC1455" /LENGTH=312 /DNA_ID=CAMNT_0007318001 /DNA_START=17 /DNA_END=955 /DNA_ORIENTATION=+